jgi:membrane protease YdiL (CAAX protease family)
MKLRAATSRNLLTSLVLVLPLLIVYHLGVLWTLRSSHMLNGADFVTVFLRGTLGLGDRGYLAFFAIVLALFVVTLVALKKRQPFNPRVFVPVLLESTIYALSMGSLIVLVMTKVLGISPQLAAGLHQMGIGTRFVMSLGAGVYEETVFRLALLGGLAALGEKTLHWKRWFAVVVAFAISSIAFSAVHHIPPYGDPFALGVFTFRVLAGVCFGLLFWFRGFAVAVYTHALYDVYVLLFR